jgi:hypothetical protein
LIDVTVRDLQRRTVSATPAERLRLVRALQRSGRDDEAFDVLLAGREASEVRRALAEVPVSTRQPYAQGLGWVGVGGIRKTPGLRFMKQLPRKAWKIHAGVLGLCVETFGERRTLVLDADTGDVRGELPGRAVAHLGDVVLVQQETFLHAHDIWTLGRLYEMRLAHGVLYPARRRFVVVPVCPKEGAIVGYTIPDSRQPPVRTFRASIPGRSVYDPWNVDLASNGLYVRLAWSRTGLILDPDAGALRATIAAGDPLADEHGVVMDRLDFNDGVQAFSPSGERKWASDVLGCVAGITPSLVAVNRWAQSGDRGLEPRDELVLLDRRSGETVASFAFERHKKHVLGVRDVLYVVHTGLGKLTGVAPDGTVAWATLLPEGVRDLELAALPRRLYGLCGNRLMCFEEPA